MQAYCMKCRAQREIKNPKSIVLKNKRPATQGVCPVCGTRALSHRQGLITSGRPPEIAGISGRNASSCERQG